MSQHSGTGGQILVRTLAAHGVSRLSCVAGESYLAVLDALLEFPEIEVVTCRQEGGAAFMAEAWGKMTGQPGICFVTRGPGACNAAIGVHTAMQDSTPLILFMGQVGRAERGREAFQEIDVRQVFGGLAKWATEIDDATTIPEVVGRAFRIATTGRPGPVVIGLPEDMLTDIVADVTIQPSHTATQSAPPADILLQIKRMIEGANRPVALIGGATWGDRACADFASFASAAHLPVATSFRRQDLFNHKHGCYIGELGTGPNPLLVEKIKQADLVLVFGARLNEICTQGYTLFDIPVPRQQLIHIHAATAELGKVFTPTLAVQGDIDATAAALAGTMRIDGRKWAGWKNELRQQYLAWTAIDKDSRPQWKGADLTLIYDTLHHTLPDDAIITTDAGNFSGWAQRYLSYGRPGRLLAPISGAMGYAVPAAIGAALAAPDKTVLGICGDGGFMMTGQELATARHHGVKPIIMVCNNNMYGTIRMHQEKHYPGRISATNLTNPDFIKLAESYGAFAARIDTAADFPAAWEAARRSDRVSLLEIRMDPAQLTTNATP